ncbi:hypothetical protein CCC_03321 [Paramagnetospirillum magnetotacticum MS-1]|uniref:Uncharacterized protein n=1 Tax=Paramagnetospirillum magnetotacticum MS-1 TaxID=272627 RepID=A0A0C2Z045_PARME|nr:hypothetical protein [Paramagnetospirillum magnetotacticum]KIM00719.1 hypothetical protein CCC_03321 [Paramagnetospirillum magnetotacticum MS-1]
MRATSKQSIAAARAREAVGRTLSGPVMAKLAELVPDLAWAPKGRELETTLRDCDLLHRCFIAFRTHRADFRPLLLDSRNKPVENDNTPLVCGRTVNQIVAMIVRSAAKRHFRARLDGFPPGRAQRLRSPEGVGWGGMLTWMGERVEESRGRKNKGRGDHLYDAIRRYLLHDWQVPIIAQYARMTPPEVRALGSRILDFRDAADLGAWLDGGADARAMPAQWKVEPVSQPPGSDPVPEPEPEPVAEPVQGAAALPGAGLTRDGRSRLSQVLSDDGRLIRMETVVPLLTTPALKAALGHPGREELRRAARALAGTGSGTVRRLAVDYGLNPEQMTAMLAKSALLLPPAVYEKMFGRKGELLLILALIGRAKAAGLDADASPAAFAAFMEDLFGRFAR